MKAAELRTKSVDELRQLVENLKREQFNLRFQRANGELANTSRFNQARRELAQVKTVMNEKNRAARKEK